MFPYRCRLPILRSLRHSGSPLLLLVQRERKVSVVVGVSNAMILSEQCVNLDELIQQFNVLRISVIGEIVALVCAKHLVDIISHTDYILGICPRRTLVLFGEWNLSLCYVGVYCFHWCCGTSSTT